MRLKYSWLFPASFLTTSSLAIHLRHDASTPYDVSELEFYTQGKQQPIFSEQLHLHSPSEHTSTVYETLASNPRFSLVTKAINFVEDIASLLNDTTSDLTFFAPPDQVLRRPRGSPPPRNLTSIGDLLGDSIITSGYPDLTEVLPLIDELDTVLDGTPDQDKRKKIAKVILRAILSYHIIPGTAYNVVSLASNITYPTHLQIAGAFDGEPLRLRITHNVIPPATHINFYTRIAHPDVKATNGIIHVVDHPLLPPPSVFQELYLIPRHFSILTSALQRSKLTDNLDLRYIHGKGLEGTSLVTIFAPTNRAFESLPAKLQLFLFSPFGERVLQKLLQYHIVPGAAVHSNYIHGDAKMNNEEPAHSPPESDHGKTKPPILAEPIFSTHLTLNTLFENHTLGTYIVQKKLTFPKLPGHKQPYLINTKVFVNHHPVVVPDVVSLNGAIHVVNRLLDPRKKPHRHHEHHHHGHHRHHEEEDSIDDPIGDIWVDWESWLPQWADEMQ
ncbi:FAS1 domain-containing protein [Pholiota molesta]|nr:FAS1 domain-containing protein [Pholiota molesta]